MMGSKSRAEFHQFFPRTMLAIELYLDPCITLNRRAAQLMLVPLVGCVLAIVWGLSNIVRLSIG